MKKKKKKQTEEQRLEELEKTKRDEHISQHKRWATASIVICLFAIHGTIVKTSMTLFTCMDLGRKQKFLIADLNIQCWEGAHIQWVSILGVLMILLEVLGIPLMGFIVLYKNRNSLHDPRTMEKYHFLYLGYKDKYYFWEIVVVTKKSLIVIVNIFFPQQAHVQALFIVFIVVSAIAAHAKVYPFDNHSVNNSKNNTLNRAEAFSLMCSFSIFFFAQFLFPDTKKDTPAQIRLAELLASTMIVASHSVFLTGFGIMIIKYQVLGLTQKVVRRFEHKKPDDAKEKDVKKEKKEVKKDEKENDEYDKYDG